MDFVYIILLVASSVSESIAISSDANDRAVLDTKASHRLMREELPAIIMNKGMHETRRHADSCRTNLASLMSYIHKHNEPILEGGTDDAEFIEEQQAIKEVGAKTICETGFNAGVSSLAWLCASPDITVHSFDIGRHPYIRIARDYLWEQFGKERLTLTVGDSTKTIPAAIQAGNVSCDVAFVDGGHSFEVASADIKNFGALMSKPQGRLLVENCNAQGKKNGMGGMAHVNDAYLAALNKGIIKHERQVSTAACRGPDLNKCREICVASYL
mmetsp:Transcript_60287/g.113758  ORF Transcript_60287/g.113758 Transcript_60287/m.113758 type:complete len:271 (-) Transcript_60287:49-861(-)